LRGDTSLVIPTQPSFSSVLTTSGHFGVILPSTKSLQVTKLDSFIHDEQHERGTIERIRAMRDGTRSDDELVPTFE
jgi:hypothetical protein